MKKILKWSKLIVPSMCLIALASCGKSDDKTSSDNQLKYNVNVIDIDGEEIYNHSFKTTSTDSLFKDLCDNTTVDFTESSYGHMIKSINNSIVDNNYYLCLYENDQMSSVGIDSIHIDNNDKFTFKVECYNTVASGYGILDETDILVDKIVYGFYKRAKTILSSQSYIDYNLLFAYNKLISLGYDFNYDFVSDTIKNSYSNIDYSTLTANTAFKYALGLKSFGYDLDEMKQFIQTKEFDISTDFITSYLYYYAIMKDFGVEAPNISTYISNVNNYNLIADDTSCMVSTMRNDSSFLADLIFDSYTEKGFNVTSSWGDYCNCASTSQAILALTAMGVNPRNNDKDYIKALLTYESDYVFKDSKDDAYYLSYATPQAIAALMSYKAFNDSGEKALNIYA